MRKGYKLLLSIFFIVLGIIIQVYSIIPLLKNQVLIAIHIFLLGYILFYVGKAINNVEDTIINFLTHSAVFLISIGIFLSIMGGASTDISESIQPTIDFVIADSYEEILNQYLVTIPNREITVAISENPEMVKLSNHNLTQSQANRFIRELGIDTNSNQERLFLAKGFINLIYHETQKIEELRNVNLPISILANEFLEYTQLINQISFLEIQQICNNQDLAIQAGIISEEIISNFCNDNPNAIISIIYAQNTSYENLNPNNINPQLANQIWNNLRLDNQISDETKIKVLQILFGIIVSEQEELTSRPIPLDVVSDLIPQEIRYVLNYDLFSNNINDRIDSIQSLRVSCEEEQITIDEACEVIFMTKYDNLMTNLIPNLEQEMGIEMSEDIKEILSKYDTIDKIELQINKISEFYLVFVFAGFLFILLSLLFVFYHTFPEEKIAKRLILSFQIVNKKLLISFIPYTIMIAIIVILFKFIIPIIFVKIFEGLNVENVTNIISNISILPMYQTISKIFFDIFLVHIFIIILLFVILLIVNFIEKKEKGSTNQNLNSIELGK